MRSHLHQPRFAVVEEGLDSIRSELWIGRDGQLLQRNGRGSKYAEAVVVEVLRIVDNQGLVAAIILRRAKRAASSGDGIS